MIDSWHLSKNKLVFQQSLGVKTLTYVRFLKQHAEIKHFKLPSNIVISNPITATLSKFI